MRKINSIQSVYLTEVNFNIKNLEEHLRSNAEVELQVSMAVEQLQKDSDNNFRANIAFFLRHKNNSDIVDLMKISHLLEFATSDKDFNLKNKNDNFVLFSIIEPYVRVKFNELISQTKFSFIDLPYKFWELSDDEPKV